MLVGKSKVSAARKIYAARSLKSIDYAIKVIRNSEVAPFVKALYWYGSSARNEQTYNSDVDLFLELKGSFDFVHYKSDIILLRSRVIPPDLELAEVDLKVVVGSNWRNNPMLYYQNVKRDGINLWNIK